MTNAAPNLDTLIAEVAALKRRVRAYGRALCAGVAIGLGAAVVFASSPLHSQAQKLTLQELTLVDANGDVRGVWSGETGIALNNSALAFYNAGNVRRMLVNVADDEPTVYFLDRQGRTRMYLDVNAAEEPRLGLNDDDLKGRVFLTVNSRKAAVVELRDDNARRRIQLNVEGEANALTFHDINGTVTTRLQPR